MCLARTVLPLRSLYPAKCRLPVPASGPCRMGWPPCSMVGSGSRRTTRATACKSCSNRRGSTFCQGIACQRKPVIRSVLLPQCNLPRLITPRPTLDPPTLEAQRSGPITAEVRGSSPRRPTTTRIQPSPGTRTRGDGVGTTTASPATSIAYNTSSPPTWCKERADRFARSTMRSARALVRAPGRPDSVDGGDAAG